MHVAVVLMHFSLDSEVTFLYVHNGCRHSSHVIIRFIVKCIQFLGDNKGLIPY